MRRTTPGSNRSSAGRGCMGPRGVLAQQAEGVEQADDARVGNGTRAVRGCARRRIPPTLTPSGSVTSTIRPGPRAAPCRRRYGPYRVGRGPNHVDQVWRHGRRQRRLGLRPVPEPVLARRGGAGFAPGLVAGGALLPERRHHVPGLPAGVLRARLRQPGELRHQPGSAQADLRRDGSLAPGPWQRRRSRGTDTMPGTNVQPVKWSPTEVGGAGSTASAWMGMRSHGDLSRGRSTWHTAGPAIRSTPRCSSTRATTGSTSVGSVSVNGTDHNFPGYGSQMDQMLYRDVTLAEGDGLTISFNFSTNMSTLTRTPPPGFVPAGSTRTRSATRRSASVPVPSPSSDGNFISSGRGGCQRALRLVHGLRRRSGERRRRDVLGAAVRGRQRDHDRATTSSVAGSRKC